MPANNLITRFPNGVNNAFDNDIFASLRVPDRSIYHEFVEDFDKFIAAQWILAGAGVPVAPVLVAGDGGLLSMANDTADNSSNIIQQAVPAWTLQAGKRLFFRARANTTSSTECDLVFGLQVAVAANNILTPTDGVFIRKPDNISTLELVSRVGGVETVSVAFGPIASITQFEVSFAYDGQGNIVGSINGQVAVSITPTALTAVPLAIVAGIQNGSAASRTMLLDQLFVAKER